jgi:hypothetical protein
MAKSAANLRVALSDDSLDVIVPADTLAWALLVAIAVKRDAINVHRGGDIVVSASESGGFAVHLHSKADTLLFDTSATP